jgi:hypothetical protein
MSSKDTTGDKLVSSIRKAKSSSASRGGPAKKAAKPKPAAPVKKKAKAVVAGSENSARKQRLVDLFQSGRRVWPD